MAYNDDKSILLAAAIEENIASWRRIFGGIQSTADPRDLLWRATCEFRALLDTGATVHPETAVETRQVVFDALAQMAEGAGIPADDAQAIVADSLKRPEAKRETPRPEIEPAKPTLLRTVSAADFAGREISAPRWLVCHRIPMGKHVLLSGDGAAGKTTIMLQLCAAVVGGAPDWLGAVVEQHGGAHFLTGEEDEEEVHPGAGGKRRSTTRSRATPTSNISTIGHTERVASCG